MEQDVAQDQGTKQEGAQSNETDAKTLTDGNETLPAESGKTLVVYYSASGNTERVANMIDGAAGASSSSGTVMSGIKCCKAKNV